MSRTDPQVNIRIPADLLQRVAADATANKRSTTAEIVARLEATGKTLRDEFAMAALTGICSNDHALNNYIPAQCAQWAYQFADAMLASRQKAGA